VKKFTKPTVPQKPIIYLKFSDLGNLPENEASIALDLLAQCGSEHFLRAEAELVKRLASNLALADFMKKQIAIEIIDVAPLIAKLVSIESAICRYLRECRMTVGTREKPAEPIELTAAQAANNDDLFEDMADD